MPWDDEVEYWNQKGDVRHADGEEYAGLYAENLLPEYRFQWHIWREGVGPSRHYRVVLDLFTPWDTIDWDTGHKWKSRQTARRWAQNAVRVLASAVRGYIEEHGSHPGVHEAIEHELAELPRILGAPPGQPPAGRRKQDWTPRGGFRRRDGEKGGR